MTMMIGERMDLHSISSSSKIKTFKLLSCGKYSLMSSSTYLAPAMPPAPPAPPVHLSTNITELRRELFLARGYPSNPPRPVKVQTWKEYCLLPPRRTGCVAMRQIGIVHGPVDVFFCCTLGLSGLLFGLLLDERHGVRDWAKVLVAVEAGVVATTSVMADGLLNAQLIPIDKKTAAVHMLMNLGILCYFVSLGVLSWAAFCALLAAGAASILVFHRRVRSAIAK